MGTKQRIVWVLIQAVIFWGCIPGGSSQGNGGDPIGQLSQNAVNNATLMTYGCSTVRHNQPGLVIQAADHRTPHLLAERSAICILNGDPVWAYNPASEAGCNDTHGHPVANRCVYLYHATAPRTIMLDHAFVDATMAMAEAAYLHYGIDCFYLDDVDAYAHHTLPSVARVSLNELITRMHGHPGGRFRIGANLAACTYPPTGNPNTEFDFGFIERDGDGVGIDRSCCDPQSEAVLFNPAFVSCSATPGVHPGILQAFATMGVAADGRGIAIHSHNALTSSNNDWMPALAVSAGVRLILAGPRPADHTEPGCDGIYPCWAYGADFPTDLGSCSDACAIPVGSGHFLSLCDHGALMYNDTGAAWNFVGNTVNRFDGLLVRTEDAPPPTSPPPTTTCHPSAGIVLGSSCEQGCGPCMAYGVWACQGTITVCSAVPPAGMAHEICGNGVDDNCNCVTDESGCDSPAPPPECASGAVRSCYTGPGVTYDFAPCRRGTQSCVSGHWSVACDGQVLPVAEICGNRADDNCNGAIDEFCAPPMTSRPHIIIHGVTTILAGEGYGYLNATGGWINTPGIETWPGSLNCSPDGAGNLSCLPPVAPPAGAAWTVLNGQLGDGNYLAGTTALMRPVTLSDGRSCLYTPNWPRGTPNVICPAP